MASSIHAKTCADVLMHAGPSGAKALMLLNPDLDCSTAIEPNTPVCIAAQGEAMQRPSQVIDRFQRMSQ